MTALDRIHLRGLKVFAHHGVFGDERETGQVFIVDVTIYADLTAAGASDKLGDTVDYGRMATAIHDRVAKEQHQLIERVAERIADVVLEDPRVNAVDVSVHKPHAAIAVAFSDVVVSITRTR